MPRLRICRGIIVNLHNEFISHKSNCKCGTALRQRVVGKCKFLHRLKERNIY